MERNIATITNFMSCYIEACFYMSANQNHIGA